LRGVNTSSARRRRYLFNAVLGLVGLGIPVFAALGLYPAMADWRDRSRELAEAEESLARWLRTAALPTQTQIDAERRFTAALAEEIERTRGFYRSRDRMLERNILDSLSGDAMAVKLKYVDLRAALAARARCPNPRKFLPVYPWEAPRQVPPRSDFKSIEKRACIVDVLVSLLAPVGSCAVDQIVVGDPVRPAPEQAAFSEGWQEPGDDDAVDYAYWPVDLQASVSFPFAGAALAALATPDGRSPLLLIHSLRVTGADGDTVTLQVGLRVLDFD